MEAAAAAASSASLEARDKESAVENLWSELLALKELYDLLQHTEAPQDVPHGEIKEGLGEKSRNLMRRLLDGATQQALQHHHAKVYPTASVLPFSFQINRIVADAYTHELGVNGQS
ncbi:hypothetical protein OPV22_009996 [Ensete ventricosum]|uniref:Nuclear nucleic acid-binding protein C1D n=1 Tax=Ensete ventricosum TaxID=4639 RepID=A0AAV8RC45_ENSVE|nr:hypothetical protein OPV22_009996 [Ensete ventricosum]